MSEKVVTSAIVVAPPEELWDPIQAIRSVHDKGASYCQYPVRVFTRTSSSVISHSLFRVWGGYKPHSDRFSFLFFILCFLHTVSPVQLFNYLAFHRWMPHVNLIYPFVPAAQFVSQIAPLTTSLSFLAPFTLKFVEFGSFDHGRSNTIYLRPECDVRLLQLL